MKNIANIKKEDLIKRFNFKCIHSHNGLDHWNCFDQFNNIQKKIAFLDIETSNLKANWGFVFSYCLIFSV